MTSILSIPAATRVLGEGLSQRGRGHEDCGPSYQTVRNPRPQRRGDLRMIEAPPEIAARRGHSFQDSGEVV